MSSLRLTSSTTPKLRTWVTLAIGGITAAIATGRAELAALAAPFALLAIIGLLAADEPTIDVELSIDTNRLVEGDIVCTHIHLTANATAGEIDLRLKIPARAKVISDSHSSFGGPRWTVGPTRRAMPEDLDLIAGIGADSIGIETPREVDRTLTCQLELDRWGNHVVGPVTVHVQDRLGVRSWRGTTAAPIPVRVLPSGASIRRLVDPLRTRSVTGSQVVSAAGGGVEFAETRPYQSGDPARSINWKVTARRGVPFANARHAERSADVVLVLDVFADQANGMAHGLELGVRAAGALAASYLSSRDRVGLVVFGGMVDWLLPGSGRRTLDRIVDRLLAARSVVSDAIFPFSVMARQALPPRSLAIAISPLHDDRMIEGLVSLRRQGHDLLVVRIVPSRPSLESISRALSHPEARWRQWIARATGGFRVGFSSRRNSIPLADLDRAQLALRLWDLELRRRERLIESMGVAVITWDGSTSLEADLAAAVAARRRMPSA